MIKLINVTPHPVHLYRDEGHEEVIKTLAASASPARVVMTTRVIGTLAGMPFRVSEPGEIVDLPDPVEGVVYVASLLVALAAKRVDVVSPDDVVRDDAGRVIGCRAFARCPGLALGHRHLYESVS